MAKEKRNKITLVAFQMSSGWALATRAEPGETPKIFTANMARGIAAALRAGKSDNAVDNLVKWFVCNFSYDLLPDIANQLESLAALVDRENTRRGSWIITGGVINVRDGNKRLH